MNQTLKERARSIRLQADMSEGFWAKAVNHASYLVNMSPSTSIDLQTQRRYGEEYLWTIQPYRFSVARHIVWLIVRKGTNWSPSLRLLAQRPLARSFDDNKTYIVMF